MTLFQNEHWARFNRPISNNNKSDSDQYSIVQYYNCFRHCLHHPHSHTHHHHHHCHHYHHHHHNHYHSHKSQDHNISRISREGKNNSDQSSSYWYQCKPFCLAYNRRISKRKPSESDWNKNNMQRLSKIEKFKQISLNILWNLLIVISLNMIIVCSFCSAQSLLGHYNNDHQHHWHHWHHWHHHHRLHHNNHHLNHPHHHRIYLRQPNSDQYYRSSKQSLSQYKFTSLASTPSFHFLHQMIRQKTLSKQRRHRHAYYSDSDADFPTSNRFNLTTTNDSKMAVTTRQNGARSLFTSTTAMITSQQNTDKIKTTPKIIYQLNWIKSDDELPLCEQWQVCNKMDTYSTPWIEKQCRCPRSSSCPMSLNANDEHTIVDKTKQYKLCDPVIKKLPICRYFRDITWTITTTTIIKSEQEFNSLLNPSNNDEQNNNPNPVGDHHQYQQNNENITKQEMKCICPINSVAYILKHQVYKTPEGQLGYRYYFACSPETKLRCRRKEPCRLFTARKRPKVEEVTYNTLCQCSNGYSCPTNHRQASVVNGNIYPLDNIRIYSGYCYPNDSSSVLNNGNEPNDSTSNT